jgi:hypothetical protein
MTRALDPEWVYVVVGLGEVMRAWQVRGGAGAEAAIRAV